MCKNDVAECVDRLCLREGGWVIPECMRKPQQRHCRTPDKDRGMTGIGVRGMMSRIRVRFQLVGATGRDGVVASLPNTWTQTMVSASHWVGLTFPGMIVEPVRR